MAFWRDEAPLERELMCSCYLQFLIASLNKRKSPANRNRRASAARCAAGRPARKITGSALAAWNGTPLIQVEYVLLASISGLKLSASRAVDGLRILCGMPIRENDDLSNECGKAVLESRAGSTAMPFIDTSALEVIERLPGWYGRYFHSPSMTFAHYDFKRGSSIHEHFHPQEEVYEVIEGELELNIDGVRQVARPGLVGIVPSNVPHWVKALTDGRAIIVDYPLRTEMSEMHS